jgi:hypothetical protein
LIGFLPQDFEPQATNPHDAFATPIDVINLQKKVFLFSLFSLMGF